MQINMMLIVALLISAAFTIEAQFQQRMANNRLFQAQNKEREYRSKYEALSNTRTQLINYDTLNDVAATRLNLVPINLQDRQATSIIEALGNGDKQGEGK